MIARLVKFSAAGALGFLVQIACVALFTTVDVNYLVATAIGVELAIVINFVWHRTITWADRPAGNALRQFVRFNALTAVTSIAASVALTGLLVETAGVSPVLANIVSVAALGLVNFVGADTLVFRTGTLFIALAIATHAHASPDEATLQAKTVRSFAKYSAAVEEKAARGLAVNEPFLQYERLPAAEQARILALLKRGEVYVERAEPARDAQSKEVEIDGGLVNHWRGTVFVPKVSLDDLLKVLKEPQSDQHKQEDVLSSKVVARSGSGDQQKVYLRLRRTKFVTVVYDTEYDVEYRRLAPDRALSTSLSTRIVEIEDAGTPKERSLPEGDDHGYMWRLNSYWRYKQLNDGVLVEVESVTLSRDMPPIIGTLIGPIVSSTARESMSRTLASVRARFAH